MIHEQYRSIITDTDHARALAERVLKEGCVTLDNFVDEATARQFDAFVADIQNIHKQKGDELTGTPIYNFGMSDEVLAFCQAVHDARVAITGEERVRLPKDKQVVGTPYKNAADSKTNEVTDYHYDGAFVNLTLPLILPENPLTDGGNLILFPNLRRRFSGIVCKVLSRLLRHSAWLRKKFGYQIVPYKVGALNLFFGDLSFHGVEPLYKGERLVITINSHW